MQRKRPRNIISLFGVIFLAANSIFFAGPATAAEDPSFRIMTESEQGDYIGLSKSWDLSDSSGAVLSVVNADTKRLALSVSSQLLSNMRFEFVAKTGDILEEGLYSPAKRYPFNDTLHGMDVAGDGRGCNKILGAFYVHEYIATDGELESAAIDFVQVCEPQSDDIFSAIRPHLYGSIRYNSEVADSCNDRGCADAREYLGYDGSEAQEDVQIDQETSGTVSEVSSAAPAEIITNPSTEAYKAIVQIRTFIEDANGNLKEHSSGSGVIVSSDGLVLTNHHVVTYEEEGLDDGDETALAVCLTETVGNAPDCSYYGALIASDEDLDLAILRINPIAGLSSKTSYDYLSLKTADDSLAGDELTAYGYPGIGSETITITRGIISGKLERYNKKWIKTDAVVSFGSSGGAALDENDNIIGLTSNTYSDLASSLGYVISVDSVNPWFLANKGKVATSGGYEERLNSLLKKIKTINNSLTFTNDLPSFTLSRQAGWHFDVSSEEGVEIRKDSGGSAHISTGISKFPFLSKVEHVNAAIKRDLRATGILSLVSISKNSDTTLSGLPARSVELMALGERLRIYYVPVDNYLLEIYYDYGENEQEKAAIDSMINSLLIRKSSQSFSELKDFTSSDPVFSLHLNSDWSLLPLKSKSHPVKIGYKKNPNISADIEIEEAKDITANNEAYIENHKQIIKKFNLVFGDLDARIEMGSTNAHFDVNGSLKDVAMFEVQYKSISTGDILSQTVAYSKKIGNKWIVFSMDSYDSLTDFTAIKDDFKTALGGFSLSGQGAISQDLANGSESSLSGDAIKNKQMYQRLKGRILIKVEDSGKAYYVHPRSENIYYLGRPADAFAVMRQQGVGIKNTDLEKIPIGSFDSSGKDSDGDGLADPLEEAIGTDKNNADTDADGYKDKEELKNAYSPLQKGKALVFDKTFTDKQKGLIFLQVEKKGEAWFVNPADGKRYFLGRPEDAFSVMRQLGLGISDKDFSSI